MKTEIDKALRETFNKYLVRHVPIKDDTRCRTEIMFEEMTNHVLDIVSKSQEVKT